jgi:hypothetical protein
MKAVTRRQLEMGRRALDFSRANPDPSPGSVAALASLEGRVRVADQLAMEQQEGIRQVRAATARKREIRRALNESHLAHVALAGKSAAAELPELQQTFAFSRDVRPYADFRSRAQSLVQDATTHKELLVKYGLADTTLTALEQSLADFDAAVSQGLEARVRHVGASAKLEAVAAEVVQIVKVMDGLNRFRFRNEPDLLAEWKSVSRVQDYVRQPDAAAPAAGTPTAGQVKPAA